ncbi:MAG: hypothetical protein Kow0080_31050 [Candidatus Promineifilaceae bacterium]
MSKKEGNTYKVGTAINSAIGDHAQVRNYFAQPAGGEQDVGLAELGKLFEQVNERLAKLEEADREMLKPAVQQTAAATAAIQQGDESKEKQNFLAKRLKNLYAMSEDIGAVIITTLASPAAGVALTLQKIAQKAKEEVGIKEGEED